MMVFYISIGFPKFYTAHGHSFSLKKFCAQNCISRFHAKVSLRYTTLRKVARNFLSEPSVREAKCEKLFILIWWAAKTRYPPYNSLNLLKKS